MVIVVTGASSGIGFSIAEYLGKKGHKVYGFSRKTVENSFFKSVSVNITHKEEIDTAIHNILQNEGRIDVLINNAGMGMVGAVEDSSAEEILNLFNLNLVGAVQMMNSVLPNMRENQFGKVINISSIGSEMGLPFRGFYSASKAALDKVTEAIRYEVYQWNIQVTSLNLGDIKTNIADNRIRSSVSEPYKQIFDKVYSLMNVHVDKGTEPKEVAIYIEKLLEKKQLKPHYNFGKFGQKIAITIKKILPQLWFESLMKSYNHLK